MFKFIIKTFDQVRNDNFDLVKFNQVINSRFLCILQKLVTFNICKTVALHCHYNVIKI